MRLGHELDIFQAQATRNSRPVLVSLSLFRSLLAQIRRTCRAAWLLLWGVFICILTLGSVGHSQEDQGEVQARERLSEEQEAEARTALREQIQALNDPNYRVRQNAYWRLSRSPELSISTIRGEIATVDHNAGAQLVELLTEFALSNSPEIRMSAVKVLEQTAQRLSSVGRLSANALAAIADLQEEQAIELLSHHGAIFGPRTFSLNGQLGQFNEDALYIGESFTGDAATIEWIRWIKSVETVCLEGPAIHRGHLEAVAAMEGVTSIKLKHVKLNAGDLRVFENLKDLRHLGLVYVEAGDEIIDDIKRLPLSESLKMYGTEISREAADALTADLSELEVFYGNGGFLGVGPETLSSTRIIKITANSAAMLAGIQIGDVLTHVNDTEVKTFADLRTELGKYPPRTEIAIKLIRDMGTPAETKMEVFAVLKEEP